MQHDIRFALRMLAKNWNSTVIVLGILAIAIGANTAIFSVMNAALLKQLPVHNPNELVMLTDPNASMVLGGMLSGERSLLGYEEFTRLRDRSKTLSGLCASQLALQRWPVRVRGASQEQARGRLVSENYFAVFGVKPAIGRLFTQSDAAPGQDPYAVISYDYWLRRFVKNPSIVGTTIRIHTATLVIVGVAAPGFRGETAGQDPDLWVPLLMQPLVMPGGDALHDFMDRSQDKLMWLHVFGRRKPGVTMAEVQGEMSVLFRHILETDYSTSMAPLARKAALNQDVRVRAVGSGAFHGREEFSQQWTILLALAGLVLLVACVNIANLLLARAVVRTREVAIRLSMGAGKARMVRQFLIEGLFMAILGGVGGILVAALASRVLPVVLANGDGGLELAPEIDLRVLAFTAGIVLSVGILFGLAPAFRITSGAIHERLKESGRAISGSRQRSRSANALVITQVALSFLLVVGAGLFLQTLQNLQTVSLGYPRENLLLIDLDFSGVGQAPVKLDRELAARIRAIPGVRQVAYSDRPLLNGFDGSYAIEVEGFTSAREEDRGSAGSFVGPEYFSTIGIPILTGRAIGPHDATTSPHICVINEAFARHFFSGRNPIGKHLMISSVPTEIVGITKDARVNSLRGTIEPKFYAAADQNSGAFSFEIRTIGDPHRLQNVIRRSLLSIDENLSISDMQTLAEKIHIQNAEPKLIADISTTFGVIALFLAAIGIYAVLSYNVVQRRSEFGIRMALGAEQNRITRMILKQTGLMIVAGLIVGVISAAAAARVLAAQLYGINPTGPRWSLAHYEHVDSATQLYGISAMDLPTIAVTICILVTSALTASYIPAVRAARVDPASVLRQE
jgi:predicted permease